ncbi:MAG: hypothetical protein GY842_18145, partial [bacterium]|nr:hypothetical protein [bacterium]
TCDAFGICQDGSDPCLATHWCYESGASCILYGDADFEPDGDVDLEDFAAFQTCYGETAIGFCQPANLNGSGTVDIADYVEFETTLGGPS